MILCVLVLTLFSFFYQQQKDISKILHTCCRIIFFGKIVWFNNNYFNSRYLYIYKYIYLLYMYRARLDGCRFFFVYEETKNIQGNLKIMVHSGRVFYGMIFDNTKYTKKTI